MVRQRVDAFDVLERAESQSLLSVFVLILPRQEPRLVADRVVYVFLFFVKSDFVHLLQLHESESLVGREVIGVLSHFY
jgi:hypothetical protein